MRITNKCFLSLRLATLVGVGMNGRRCYGSILIAGQVSREWEDMHDPSPRVMADSFREFDRCVAKLNTELWGGGAVRPCGVAEGRVLHAVAVRGSAEPSELRRALTMDAGFLSRLLRGLERRGLLTRSRSPMDGRRQIVRLTAAGRALCQDSDRHLADRVRLLLEPMSPGERQRLLVAMTAICGVLDAALPYRDAR
ncbi:MAG: winged helix DNA-binding protein [Streptosporangiales bacterium]|nr:winged helix DNA-binding protein [Streptosporangiales bacterium]